MNIISRGFAGLGSDAAHSMFAFAANPWAGLCVGVLGTVLIQSSTTTTAIAVTAVGAGALPIRAAIPIIIGANLGTTVTPTLVALTFLRRVHSRPDTSMITRSVQVTRTGVIACRSRGTR